TTWYTCVPSTCSASNSAYDPVGTRQMRNSQHRVQPKTLGTTWSPAIKVTQGTTQADRSNVFPWVAADADGHVAIAWYGADAAGNSNTISATNTHWNVFVAESVNGHAPAPVLTLSQASDHSNHTAQILTGGL